MAGNSISCTICKSYASWRVARQSCTCDISLSQQMSQYKYSWTCLAQSGFDKLRDWLQIILSGLQTLSTVIKVQFPLLRSLVASEY